MRTAPYSITVLALLVACNSLDPYAEKFQQLSVGDTRARAVELMGPASAENSFQIALVSASQLTWRSQVNARSYTIHVVSDRIVTKFAVQ